jgi:sulfate adenylyltransferase subunit 1
LEEAFAPESVTLTLEDEIDISRGDMIVDAENQPTVSQDLDVMVCWLGEKKLQSGGKYTLRHTTRDVRCLVKAVQYKVNVNTLERVPDDTSVGLNEIARLNLRTTSPLFFDPYRRNRITGSLILIDEATNETVAAGMIQ